MDTKPFTCLNGSFVLAHRAAVAVADRGWRYGDGVFETIRVERGVPYQFSAHMERLREGLRALSIPQPEDLAAYAQKLLKKNKAGDGYLRISISRGIGSRGYAPHPPGMPPTWVMEWIGGLNPPAQPCKLWLTTFAAIPPQCLPTQYKTAQGLNHILSLQEAQQQRCDEALQLTTDGIVSGCSSGNIFWLHDDILYTPSLDTGCLAGITRETLIRLCPITVKLVTRGIQTLADADAVFMCNSRIGVWPVAQIQPMGWKFTTAHPRVRQLQNLLDEDRQRDLFAQRKSWSRA
jgi:branched-subunit amino acid aminotransferase/4-amino-4-deoxychorismate lyase